MKKTFLLVCTLLLCVTTYAQKDELKTADKAIKNNDYAAAADAITQAEGLIEGADDKSKAKFYYLKGETYAGLAKTDPSEDNFDAEEVYRDVYGLKNPQEIINKRKIKEQEFIEKIQNEEATEMELVSELKKPEENVVIPEVEEKVEPVKAKVEKDIKKFKISDS